MITEVLKNGVLLCCLLLIALLTLFGTASAQLHIEEPSLLNRPIADIVITGNYVTDEKVILSEMKTRKGVIPTREMLELDMLRVQGLDIFTRVEFFLLESAGKSVLNIVVTEEWYIFPLPYWSLSDDTPPELTYGFRFQQKNFRGRNETLSISLWSGDDRGYMLSHTTPRLRGNPTLTSSVSLYQITQTSNNLAVKDLDLESRHTVAQFAIGKRWTREFVSGIGCRFHLVRAENPLQLAGDGLLDRIVETHVSTTWDGRDLRQLSRRGLFGSVRYVQGWVLSLKQQYQRFSVDLRSYLPYHFISLCSRLQWHPSWGSLPPYDWTIIDDNSYIRSVNLSDEGESFYSATFEIRFDLLPLRYFTWQRAPYFKQYFTNLQYGLAAEIFLETGDAYSISDKTSVDNLMWGYGVGLLLRLPYADVIRLESSWNPEYSFSDVLLSWKLGISF
ncbi:hypothetical protein CEE37_04510 [candidate division LCP-89 bacterium B3_LCP]|uniref:POTRA domain-containing protein n=1 Tax=candidate division LCP-89 bacterium B3_LCP TaxID=2012998 RepID=A0A532V3S1_UNCL8|nr:MAG: hypothetical protein CEE37_04510 [candidate division LCP-89 bacterium B3_LCP]